MIDTAQPEGGGGDANLRKMRRVRPDQPDVRNTDRLPPHSEEAERGVLGCVLLSPNDTMDECVATGIQAEWFYDLRHQLIYHTVLGMHQRRLPVDLITLQHELKQAGKLEQVGGLAYLAGLPDAVPSAANLAYYADFVREKWQLRTLLRVCTEIAGEVYTNETTVDELLAKAQKTFLDLEQQAMPAMEQRIKRIITEKVVPDLEEHYTRGKAQLRGVTTGLEFLDKILCGMGGKNGQYYVFAARPNVGKTSLATQIAMHAALDYQRWEEVTAADFEKAATEGLPTKKTDEGKFLVLRKGIPVAISSLEMRSDSLVNKMLFQRGQADLQRWRTGFGEDKDIQLLTIAAGQLATADNIIVDDTPRLRIGQLKAKWRRWHWQYGVRLFILDYLQLMQADGKRFRPDRVQELAEVSAELQALGKELNCPLIVLAQMNRDYEKDPNRAPRLSDLKDCGAVEQDADVVAFLYQPKLNDTNQEFFDRAMAAKFGPKWMKWDGRPQRINVLVGKNRLGPKGKAELLLLHSSTTFVDWNVWLKENKLKAAAMGESQYKEGGEEDEPTD